MGCSQNKSKLNYNQRYIEATEKEGETPVHVNNNNPYFKKYREEAEKTTIIQLIQEAFKTYANYPALGQRRGVSETEIEKDYTYYSYQEVKKMATNLSLNMKANSLSIEREFKDQKGKFKIFGLFARNSVEWIVNDIACQLDDITSVTFYATLGAESFDHIFKQTEISTVAVSPENISRLIEFHNKFNFETLKNVVIYNMSMWVDDNQIESLKKLSLNVYLFTDLIKDVDSSSGISEKDLCLAKPNSILTLCYTSGTTSLPKGAMLSQKGLACQRYLLDDTGIGMSHNDVQLSYLPLAHVMERANILVSLTAGLKVAFISGSDIKKYLMDDLLLVKPTILIAVPRILINFHQKVMETFGKLEGCAKTIADSGLKAKRDNYTNNHDIYHTYYDTLVFKKIRSKFGGRLRAIVSGSAPIPRDICSDIKIMLSVPLCEGYGMTELHGGSHATSVSDFTNKNIGGVLRTLEFKLVDKKELNYHSGTKYDGKLAPTGEICYKGPSVFTGYFRDEEKTKETLDSDGWLHTGDVGMIDPDNKGLKIVDRVKEIFKLSQGEYIAPSKLEGLYVKSPLVAQLCIYGNSHESNILAIVVINKEKCSKYLIEEGIMNKGDDFDKKYLKEEKLHSKFKKDFDEIAKINNFNTLEKPRKFILTLEEFSPSNDLMTPTMKLVRKKIQEKFKDEIDEAYKNK